MQDREQAYQQAVPDSVGSYTGAALGEVLPWATGIGEARALGLLPTASKTLGKLGLLGGEGAAMSAIQPVTNGGQDYGADKAKQVAIERQSVLSCTGLRLALLQSVAESEMWCST
ncbi:hypothetical protein J2T07_002574 [Luteibacter jiangsuensis]|uniref:Uncharacterized protein n=1 Tax=Luteibacter jiangsuensis TaxID=637577 RepID=A0ABT9SZF4_9GAMM|nr:hypothetical protein [Luteibacter jiangsuensis]MDQ0010384.1 hypothetical protein [Luteibacter jiangsuensis]